MIHLPDDVRMGLIATNDRMCAVLRDRIGGMDTVWFIENYNHLHAEYEENARQMFTDDEGDEWTAFKAIVAMAGFVRAYLDYEELQRAEVA